MHPRRCLNAFSSGVPGDFGSGIAAGRAVVRAVQFYRHEIGWTNRMILGDSLQVMASLIITTFQMARLMEHRSGKFR